MFGRQSKGISRKWGGVYETRENQKINLRGPKIQLESHKENKENIEGKSD